MGVRSFVVKRVGLGSLARWGFAAGGIIACLPALVCSVLSFSVITALYRVVDSWRDVGVSFFGQRISFNFVQLLQLQSFLDALRTLGTLGIAGMLAVWLSAAVAIGLVISLSLVLLGIFYNLTGRLELTLVEK